MPLLLDDIGVELVFYQDFEMGNAQKHIGNSSKPPLSRYTKLPKQFGFAKIE